MNFYEELKKARREIQHIRDRRESEEVREIRGIKRQKNSPPLQTRKRQGD